MGRLPENASQNFTPETERPSTIVHGIAISNVANSINQGLEIPGQINRLFSELGRNGLGTEVQIEFPFGNLPQIEQHIMPFSGVHLPIGGIDLLDDGLRPQSLERFAQSLAVSKQLRTDYVVAHIQTRPEWDRLGERERLNGRCRDEFGKVLQIADNLGYQGKILIENLEFPLYPATEEDIKEVRDWVRYLKTQGFNVGMALDIAHLWHTGNLIKINASKGKAIERYFRDAFAAEQLTFSQYLRGVTREISEELLLLHYTSAVGHETHLLPRLEDVTPHDPNNVLDLRQSMHDIKSSLNGKNKTVYAINEAHDIPYSFMAQSSIQIEEGLR